MPELVVEVTMERVTNFLNKNLVLVVMIPGIVGLHWGWYKLQHNEKFVKKEDQIINDQPIFVVSCFITY